mgnify:CR=1 FL=1
MEEQVKQGAPIATHKGVLAGLSEEERAQKIEAAIRHEYVEGQGDAKVSSLADQAQDGPVVTTLAGQLEAFTRDKLVEMAKDYDLKGYSKLKKPELAQAVAQACGEQDEDAVFTLIFASPAEFETARKATEAGGILTLSDEEVSQGSFLEAMPPYVYVFKGEGEFTVLVPEELRASLQRLDWASVEACRAGVEHAQHTAEVLTDFCGIVSLSDAWKQYRAWYGEGQGQESFERDVLSGVSMGDLNYGVWFLGDECYLVHYQLDEAQVSPEDEHGAEELEGFKKYLIGQHEKHEMPVLADELRQIDAIDYTLGQPSARALRNFFDAHVPDDDSDLYYADRLMESIADLNGNLVSFDETVRDLDEANLGLTAQERAEMLPLLRAMLEDLPYWENNGWSNNQVRASQGTHAFYDENGEPLKVGRNDSCPCGSGKKYKKCCGK